MFDVSLIQNDFYRSLITSLLPITLYYINNYKKEYITCWEKEISLISILNFLNCLLSIFMKIYVGAIYFRQKNLVHWH